MTASRHSLQEGDQEIMADSKMRRLLDRGSEKSTLISDGCKITGNIAGSGSYFISGHVDGDCDIEGSLTISQNGLWTGGIRARNIVIAGTVEGDVCAAGKVEINQSARINGSVTGVSIAVAEGAIVQGTMQTSGKHEPQQFQEKRGSDKQK